VQHAHQKGVIHRDLKPSNVLVTEGDGRPQVKVIDFGVAKALGPRLSTETVHTQIGMLIGTPEYMSPEQAESSGVSVDTRSDVYSLGVLLYELLVGARPFDRGDLADDSVTAMLRAVRETPAPRLGARLATLGERAPTVAAARRSDVSALARRLRGDLEWITLRALEKEPARRYASVDALAEDVRAALNGDAVTAHPPSVAYQVHRFVRRHRRGVAFAGTVFTLLVAFGVSMSVLYGRQQVERMKAERMNSFLQTMLAGANPLRSGGGDVSVRDLLDAAAHDLDELHDEPEVEAAAAQTMAYSYESLSELDSADSLARRAIRAYESAQGPFGPGTLEAKGRLASIFRSRGLPDSALALQEDVVAGLSRRRDASPRALSHATAELGRTYQELGRYEDAASQEEEAIRVLDAASLQGLPTYGSNWSYLGRTYQALGRIEDAEHAYRRALEANRANRGEESAYVAADLSNLASALRAQRKFDEAEPLFASAAELNEKLLGPDHPGVASIYNSWGLLRKQQGDYLGAESLYVKALDIRRRAYGEGGHPEIATSLNNLGVLCRVQGRLSDAERYYREALDMNLRLLGEDHPNVAMSLNNLAVVLTEEGRPREAEDCARRALALRSSALGPLHPDTVKSMRTLADATANVAEADSLRQEADRREAERAEKSAP
ncbi:MAG: serine/threonine protein kinase, partial [Gemmatimonadetes bacterium]|nr:serine/threonine protein kinase [Gemmatimonadota bacterium]